MMAALSYPSVTEVVLMSRLKLQLTRSRTLAVLVLNWTYGNIRTFRHRTRPHNLGSRSCRSHHRKSRPLGYSGLRGGRVTYHHRSRRRHRCVMPEVVLAHQLGGDPFNIHELFVLAAAAGGGLLMGLRMYARRWWRLTKLAWLRARRVIRKLYIQGALWRHHH